MTSSIIAIIGFCLGSTVVLGNTIKKEVEQGNYLSACAHGFIAAHICVMTLMKFIQLTQGD